MVASWKRWSAGVLLTLSMLGAQAVNAQGDEDTQGTMLTISGGLEASVEGSDANACVAEDGDFRAQLTPLATTTTILTFDVQASGPSAVPLGQSQANRVTLVAVTDDPNDFLINWVSSSGTLTIASLDTQVPVGDGSASTHGATGTLEADLSANGREPVHISGSWACHLAG